MKNTKKFMQHILLGSAIFLSLAAVSFPGSVAFASASVASVVDSDDLTTVRARLQTLLTAKEAAVTEELAALSANQIAAKSGLENELRKTQTLKQLTADSLLEDIADTLGHTMIPGAELAPLDTQYEYLQMSRGMHHHAPHGGKQYEKAAQAYDELCADKPLSLFVVVIQPDGSPRLDFTTFGKFQNAAHLITPRLNFAFGDDATTIETNTNALLNALYTYDLRGATESKVRMKSTLAALSAGDAAASESTTSLQRDYDLAKLEISFVSQVRQIWDNLTESLKRNGRTT